MSGRPTSRNTKLMKLVSAADEVTDFSERWDKPDAPRQKVDMHLQEITPGLRERHHQEVQTNHSALKSRPIIPPWRDGTGSGKRRLAWRPCSALTRNALASGPGADECFDVRSERRPSNRTLSQGQCFIPLEVTAEGVGWSSVRGTKLIVGEPAPQEYRAVHYVRKPGRASHRERRRNCA